MTFYPLEKLHRLTNGFRGVYSVAGRVILLIHQDGRTILFDVACPHAGQALHKGSIHHDVIRCPVHGMEFNLQTGQQLNSKENSSYSFKCQNCRGALHFFCPFPLSITIL